MSVALVGRADAIIDTMLEHRANDIVVFTKLKASRALASFCK